MVFAPGPPFTFRPPFGTYFNLLRSIMIRIEATEQNRSFFGFKAARNAKTGLARCTWECMMTTTSKMRAMEREPSGHPWDCYWRNLASPASTKPSLQIHQQRARPCGPVLQNLRNLRGQRIRRQVRHVGRVDQPAPQSNGLNPSYDNPQLWMVSWRLQPSVHPV